MSAQPQAGVREAPSEAGGVTFPRGTSRLQFEPVVYVDERGRRNVFFPASYAKGRVLFRVERGPSVPGEMRWKGRGERLVEAVGGRYTGRENGYVISPAAAEKLLRYLKDGWDAGYMGGKPHPPKEAPQEEMRETAHYRPGEAPRSTHRPPERAPSKRRSKR
jgi:hypothetical protein